MVSKEEKQYISDVIKRLIRPEAAKLVEFMLDKDEVTDEQLARNTNIKISIVRKLLYDLYQFRLIDFRRERDEKTTWFIYYVKFRTDKFNEIIVDRLKFLREKLIYRLEYEEKNKFYECPLHKKKYLLNEAILNNFKCNVEDCGEVLVEYDNSKVIEKLKRIISNIDKILEKEKAS